MLDSLGSHVPGCLSSRWHAGSATSGATRGVAALRYIDGMDERTLTPSELSREIGVDAKRIRDFLRDTFGKLDKSVESRWRLNAARAETVRRHFAAGD